MSDTFVAGGTLFRFEVTFSVESFNFVLLAVVGVGSVVAGVVLSLATAVDDALLESELFEVVVAFSIFSPLYLGSALEG